MIGTKES